MERCVNCRGKDGDHLASCPEVADTLRVQIRELEGQRYTGLLWVDEDDHSANFKFNVAGGDFASARRVLERFVAVIQKRLDNERQCPYFEQERPS